MKVPIEDQRVLVIGVVVMVLNVRTNPTINEAADLLEGAFRARSFVLIVGDCRVDYEGRASSTLEWGERITIYQEGRLSSDTSSDWL